MNVKIIEASFKSLCDYPRLISDCKEMMPEGAKINGMQIFFAKETKSLVTTCFFESNGKQDWLNFIHVQEGGNQ